MHLFVDTQPSFLFLGRQQIHDLRKIMHDALTNLVDERASLPGDLHQNFATITGRMRALHVAEDLEAIHEASGRGG